MNSIEKGLDEKISPKEMLSDEQRASAQSVEIETKEDKLARHDLEVIESLQTEWGTILAGPPSKESNSYNKMWIRDNALVALALIQAGETETATQITNGLMDLMEKYRPKIQETIKGGKPVGLMEEPPSEIKKAIKEGKGWDVVKGWHPKVEKLVKAGKPYAHERDASLIHPVYKDNGEELEIEWGWHQNDAIGNLLQAAGALDLVNDHKDITSDLVKYLEVTEYWEEDRGIWEEGKQVQTNTILSCTAGLKTVADYINVPEELIDKGYQTLDKLNRYSHSDKRDVDLAHLNPFMLGEIADPYLIQVVEHELLRGHGVIRYHGDRYMSGGKGREAEWVLGLLMLGQAWLACDNRTKANEYLKRADKLRVKGGDFPEAYIYKNGKYIPNEHTPLAWCHALSLSLRRQLAKKN